MNLAAVAPLRSKDFCLFWLGQWISQMGDNLFLVAQNWLIWSLTGSGAAMAIVTLCSQVPSIAMLLVGGVLVDRLPRRWISILSDIIRGVILLLLAALQWAGMLTPVHLYVLAALFGLVGAFARPAFGALVQALVPQGQRVAGNALVAAGRTVAGMAGPAIGGVIMAVGGAAVAFWVDGVTFLLAAAGLFLARVEEPPRATERAPFRLWNDLAEAVRLVAARPFLRVSIVAMALIVITGQAPVVLLRPWVAERVGGGATTLSLAYTFDAAGMFLMVTLLGNLKVKRRGPLIYSGMVVAGLAQVGLALAQAPWQFWLLEFITGAVIMIYAVLYSALLQDAAPPDAMGRVAAIDQFGTLVLYPIGVALIGLISTVEAGPFLAIAGGGLLTAMVALSALLHPQVRAQT